MSKKIDVEWQKVRGELTGQWNLNPDECCNKIKSFLGLISEVSDDRLKIVKKYMNNVKINHNCINEIKSLINKEIKNRK